MKKKLDTSSPRCGANIVAWDFNTCRINVLVKEGEDLSQMVSPNRSCRLKRNIDSSLTELTLGMSQDESRLIYSTKGISSKRGVVDKPLTCFDVPPLGLAAELDCVTNEMCMSPDLLKSCSDAKFFGDGECCSPLLSRPVFASYEENAQVELRNKRNRVQSQNLCPAKLSLVEDLASPLESFKENLIDGYYNTPPKYTGGSNRESVLRSLAMTYENIPSIIRRTHGKNAPEALCVGLNSLNNLNSKQGGAMPFMYKSFTSVRSLQSALTRCTE